MLKPLFKKIVVAVNGSSSSLLAAMYGIIMAKQYKCELKAVYVVDTATLRQLEISRFFVPDESARYEANLNSDGRHYLDYVCDLAKQKGVKLQTELRKGSVWSEIITVADDFKADLILLGGKKNENDSMNTILRHSRLSVTNSEIIGSANCNVLVVCENEVEKLFKLA